MKKKRKVTRKRKTLVSRDGLHSMQVSGDEILKDMNPASPMMGIASQIEKDMFEAPKPGQAIETFLKTAKEAEDISKDVDPKQPGKPEEEESCGCELLQFLGIFAVIAAVVFGVYKLLTYSDYEAGECYQHKYEKTTFSRITHVYNGLKEVDYDFVDGEENTYGNKNRDQKDFAGLYEKKVDCYYYFWMQNKVHTKR